jgi:quercetin dioxygenase-like cupin family protein
VSPHYDSRVDLRLGAVLAVSIAAMTSIPQPSQQVVVPVEREPQHRRVFSNAVLAVLDVRFPPGYVSLFHTHSNDNVSVRLETGPTRTDTLESAGVEQTALVGRVVFYSASPPYTHRVANVGTTPIRILDIEVLARAATPRASVPDDLVDHEVAVENDRVRICRVTMAEGRQQAAHTHPRGFLEVVVRGPGAGTFAWREPGSPAPVRTATGGVVEIVEIEVK